MNNLTTAKIFIRKNIYKMTERIAAVELLTFQSDLLSRHCPFSDRIEFRR